MVGTVGRIRSALAGPDGTLPSAFAPCVYDRAEVYVARFEILHAIGWGIEDVKKGYSVRISMRDPTLVSSLLSTLRRKASVEPCGERGCSKGDLRFVAEFHGESPCSGELFVADFSTVANVTAGRRGRIDKAFRDRFTNWT